jgi:hypothetical protein
VSEKAKLKRGDPPKIDFKKKGEPLKNENKRNMSDQNKLIFFPSGMGSSSM